jgi:hypothetical protein
MTRRVERTPAAEVFAAEFTLYVRHRDSKFT